MINRQVLLADLQRLLTTLEQDLLERSHSAEVPEVGETLRAEYERARQGERTALNYEDWRRDAITQMAAAWVLSCVFVRFLEDNGLIDPPKIAGPGERLSRARDEHELYFHAHPKQTDREYLLSIFDALAELRGTRDVFGRHNPIRQLPNWLSGDAAGELLRFFQKVDAETGLLIHDFTDPQWDTRFLGDLYQDLSEAARKKYALLQTPDFVEAFILDRTLEPALDEFGLEAKPEGFRMIDPACGSGHFLLGAFGRILARWQKQEPGTNMRVLVQKALGSVHGVDVNPFAVAIARFRLLLAAMQAEGVTRLASAPAYELHLAVGDSLYHGRTRQQMLGEDWTDEQHYFASEDAAQLRKLLRGGTYHCVVANPPYITPKDRAANQAYRQLYPETCHMKYSLAVPFMELLFRLAIKGEHTPAREAGYVGQITANSFMKREFGKKLIESFLPQIDLTHVIDTSGAYIPGHGTPTVILLGRHRWPVAGTIRAVMGIRGEPSTPDDPSQGLVWSAIVGQIDEPGSQSEFVSVSDSERERFHTHPWSIGGGGAAELKEQLEEGVTTRLGEITAAIGITAVTGEDELFMQPKTMLQRNRIELTRPLVEGDVVRDWQINGPMSSVWLYNDEFDLLSLENLPNTACLWWTCRSAIYWRKRFGTPLVERGLTWYEWQELYKDKLRTPLSITFAFVATHNHFVLDRGGKVFNRSAPVIKLPAEATEDDHLGLLGLLNSSTACFWMKQVFYPKGGDHVGQEGARVRRTLWDERYEFAGTGLQNFPVPIDRPLELARRIDELAQQLSQFSPQSTISKWERTAGSEQATGLRAMLDRAFERSQQVRKEMICAQEDLDWQCYRLFGLIDEDIVSGKSFCQVEPGLRAFEILLAREVASGNAPPTWFERHGITPQTNLPDNMKPDYRNLVERRIELIQTNPNINLIERPEFKRRWYQENWNAQYENALRDWLLNRLESYFNFDGRMNYEGKPTAKLDVSLTSIASLADVARRDEAFMEVGEVYRDDPAFDVERLVEELVKGEQVPLLPVLRYKPAGLRKRAEWERTWELQRAEDAIDARTQLSPDDLHYLTEDQARQLKEREVGPIPVPPKYTSADFISSGGARYWRLRGKLDVPKERWVSFPHCEGPDGTLVIAWAGYDHLQLARAISTYYVDVQERLGGRDDARLVPLLAGLVELLPWLKQWHNDIDPEFGMAMGDYFDGFVKEEARQLGLTLDEVRAWQPPRRTTRRRSTTS